MRVLGIKKKFTNSIYLPKATIYWSTASCHCRKCFRLTIITDRTREMQRSISLQQLLAKGKWGECKGKEECWCSSRVWIIFFKHDTSITSFWIQHALQSLSLVGHGAAQGSIFQCNPPRDPCSLLWAGVPAVTKLPSRGDSSCCSTGQGTAEKWHKSWAFHCFGCFSTPNCFCRRMAQPSLLGLTENSLPDFSKSSHKTFLIEQIHFKYEHKILEEHHSYFPV